MGDEQQPEQTKALAIKKAKVDDPMLARLMRKATGTTIQEYKEECALALREVRSKAIATLSAKMDDVSPNALATVIGILQDKEALLLGESKAANAGVQVNIQVNGLPSGKDGLIRTLTKGVEASVSPLGADPAEFAYHPSRVSEEPAPYGQSDSESAGSPSIKANASSPASRAKRRKSLKDQEPKGGGGGRDPGPA